MSIETPVIESQTPSAAPAVTDELLQELDRNPEKIHGLDKATRRAVMEMVKNQRDESPQDTPVIPEVKAEGNAGAKVEDKATEVTPKPNLLEAVKRAEIQEESDAANQIEQRLKAAKARRARAETEASEEANRKAIQKPSDLLDDTHQNTILETVQGLRKEIELLKHGATKREDDEIATLESELKSTKEDGVFTEIQKLQDKYPEIKTTKPMKQLNAEYAAWLDEVISASSVKTLNPGASDDKLRELAVQKFHTNPDFAKTIRAKAPEELEKLNVLLQLYHRKNQHGGTVRGHWLEMLEDGGVIADVVQRTKQDAASVAARSAANATVEAIQRGSNEITTIPPGAGSSRAGYTDPELTEARAHAEMKQINADLAAGKKLTPDQKIMLQKIKQAARESVFQTA